MKQILSGGLLMAVLAITPTISMASDINGSGFYAFNGIAVTLPELSDQELAKVEGQQATVTLGDRAIDQRAGLANVVAIVNAHVSDVVDVNNNNISVNAAVLSGQRTITVQRQ